MRLLVAMVLLGSLWARADEGMWLYDDFPAVAVEKQYGFAPDAKWLEKVRLGSLRLANGCSARFVSKDGLVLTNHHCIRSCLEDLSTLDRDLLSAPFVAKTREGEERCPKIEANQLVAIADVSDRVLAAVKDTSGAEFQKKLKAETAAIEQECAKGDVKKRCDVVTLFNGARFHLYTYRRFQDVRLVFVSGHPGGTERSRTGAHLELQRDVVLPWQLLYYAELRGRLDQWMQSEPERMRVTRSKLRSVENSLKPLGARRRWRWPFSTRGGPTSRSRLAAQARLRADRRGAQGRAGHDRLPRRDLHAAAVVRAGEGLGRGETVHHGAGVLRPAHRQGAVRGDRLVAEGSGC